MTMNTRLAVVLVSAVLVSLPCAQEAPDMSPAKELARFEPLIGHWSGGGKMAEPGGVATNWTAKGTYQWCLNKHFVQEDFEVRFEGMPASMVFRNYLGWDREGQRYVSVLASNEGLVELNPINFLPDGTMMQMLRHHQEGVPYAERARTKITGDSMSLVIDVLMSEGGSSTMIDSTMKRSDQAFACDGSEAAWLEGKPHEHVTKLAAMSGAYETKGEMVMAPGAPTMQISGTDAFRMMWGGGVMHGKTVGFAEGDPNAYESHAFWAWDAQHQCQRVVSVDNMGQLGEMESRWVGDLLVSTGLATMGGAPMTQRFVMTFGEAGDLTTGVGHTCYGASDPFVSFRASYKKKG